MKVLFLDMDGVCNSAKTFRSGGVKGEMDPVDPYMVLLVRHIIQATGCSVVLSSSWRHNDRSIEKVKRQVCDLLDITPRLPRPSGTSVEYCERGKEIEAWLSEHPEVTAYAILDDDSDMLPGQPHFKTSWEIGLTKEIADDVIKHLNQ